LIFLFDFHKQKISDMEGMALGFFTLPYKLSKIKKDCLTKGRFGVIIFQDVAVCPFLGG
jgi:hypothetical protein